MTELDIALVSTLVGALMGYGGGQLQAWLDRRRRRRAVATALLLELQSIESTMRRIHEEDDPSAIETGFGTGMHDRFLEHVDLFDAPTVRAVQLVATQVAAVRELLAEGQKSHPKEAENHNWAIRARTLLCVESCQAARAELVADGGELPPADESRLYPCQLRPLPPEEVLPPSRSRLRG